MKELIKVAHQTVGDHQVPTVNARELHAFLKSTTRFNDWIARRIAEYRFEEGKDFYSFLSKTPPTEAQEVFPEIGENPSGGRPSKEYALTLDMAKELAMVERNEKGKQARQYFIECERWAMQTTLATAEPIKTRINAAKLFRPLFNVARLIGCKKNAAAISANQAVIKHTTINLFAEV